MDPARRWTIEQAALRWPTGPLIQVVPEPGDKDASAEEAATPSSPEVAHPVPPSSHSSARVAKTPKPSKPSSDKAPIVVVTNAAAVEPERSAPPASDPESARPASVLQSGFNYKTFQDDLGTNYSFTKDAPILGTGPRVVVFEAKHNRTGVRFAVKALTKGTRGAGGPDRLELEVLKRLQAFIEVSGTTIPGSKNVLQLVESVVTDFTVCEYLNLLLFAGVG